MGFGVGSRFRSALMCGCRVSVVMFFVDMVCLLVLIVLCITVLWCLVLLTCLRWVVVLAITVCLGSVV